MIGDDLTPTLCKRCCYSTQHALGLEFHDGVCTGCIIHEEKDNTDWQEKFLNLKELVKPYISENQYDCIVPVSGGQDSFFVVYVVKHLLGLNPLLVSYNRLYNSKIGIANLERLRTRLGCDLFTWTPEPSKVQQVSRATFELFGSFHWHFLAGSTVLPVQLASRMKIPLIIWGAHQGIDQVGMFSHHDEVEMTRRYRKEHDLMGYDAESLVDLAPHLDESYLSSLFYPSDSSLANQGIRGIYLNNYIRWDSKTQHEMMIEKYGYMTSPQNRTFDYYQDIHCLHYNNGHDLIKWIKHGYTKVTDHVCREIRLKRLSRTQGLTIIDFFKSQTPMNLKSLLDWLNLSAIEFEEVLYGKLGCSNKAVIENILFNREVESHNTEILDLTSYVDTNDEFLPDQSQLLPRGWASSHQESIEEVVPA